MIKKLVDDMDLQNKLESIKNWSHEYSFEHNINPNDTPKYLQRFFILSCTVHFGCQAVAQFEEGTVSFVSLTFFQDSNYRTFHSFLVHSMEELELYGINHLFLFHYNCEKNSNKWRQINDAVSDSHLMLATVKNGDVETWMIVVLTSSVRIPKKGFEKKVESIFVKKYAYRQYLLVVLQ